MNVLEVLAALAAVVFVIGRQLHGEPLRGKRLIVLPAVLTVIGFMNLSGKGNHPTATDIACLVVSGLIAVVIGLGQGSMMRLESRDGYLWGQMPVRSLWLWGTLVTSRLVMTGVASALHAHVAASSATILLMLGINRLAQAAVVAPRAFASAIPFAPEKDGKAFLGGRLDHLTAQTGQRRPDSPSKAGTVTDQWEPYARWLDEGDTATSDRFDHQRSGRYQGPNDRSSRR